MRIFLSIASAVDAAENHSDAERGDMEAEGSVETEAKGAVQVRGASTQPLTLRKSRQKE